MSNALDLNGKLINDATARKAFDNACKTYLENKPAFDSLKQTIDNARKVAQSTALEVFNLEKQESGMTYHSLNYAIKFKNASVSKKLDENLLKEKYPEIYAECCVEVMGTPAFKEIVKL